MSSRTPPKLESFAGWIQATDDHAPHHLNLLAHVGQAWDDAGDGSSVVRSSLARKVERWRYQHLKEHAGRLTPQDEAFVDALDGAARQLAGRAPLKSRRTRHAVRDPAVDTDSIREACAALDTAFPLDRLTETARQLTQQHFPGIPAPRIQRAARHRILLYAPLYVSSDCVNYCLYCGFRYPLGIVRRHLSVAESLDQARILRGRGFRRILVVGGEFPSLTTPAYYREITRSLAADGFEPNIESAPQTTETYAELVAAGARGVNLYQETYDERLYAKYHVRGPKSAYHWRLETHDRAAEAGMPRLGLGILLGLADPRADLLAMMRHAAYLADRFPDRTLAFSLPRIHEAPAGFEIPYFVSDRDLIRFFCVLRIAFPRAGLVLSTREQAEFRHTLAKICITEMSAGSSTAPGGYAADGSPNAAEGAQFPVSDHRSPAEVAAWLEEAGFEVAWTTNPA
ncbi:MAG: radical SAM protein [Candidatus Anammoximicrobium sp.]|nr:radical SAM protein [Candidatus Anammoximicrobium sp.]